MKTDVLRVLQSLLRGQLNRSRSPPGKFALADWRADVGDRGDQLLSARTQG
ncbi:MAG: hypothetical protein HC889_19070, partial [Synechococcaceae cyanobacterium SM1_2_3]|nr:hypothetical protein [Synechococcaceae cyanobacterium SM1_2_3]